MEKTYTQEQVENARRLAEIFSKSGKAQDALQLVVNSYIDGFKAGINTRAFAAQT